MLMALNGERVLSATSSLARPTRTELKKPARCMDTDRHRENSDFIKTEFFICPAIEFSTWF